MPKPGENADPISPELAAAMKPLCRARNCEKLGGHADSHGPVQFLQTPILRERAKTIARVIYEDHIESSGDEADQPWLLRLLERTEYEARSAYGDVREPSSTEIAGALIENLSKPPAWAEAFQSIKYDTADNAKSLLPHRWIVVVAKGELADRFAALYEETL